MFVYIDGSEVVALTKENLTGIEGLNITLTIEVDTFCKITIGDIYKDGYFISNETLIPTFCVTKLEFMNRFTLTELGAIESSTDPIVKVLQRKQEIAEFIDLKDQNTIDGVGYLAIIGLIEANRIPAILSVT